MYYGLEFGKYMARSLFIFNVMSIISICNEFTLVQRQIICQFNHYIYHTINRRLMLTTMKVLSIHKFNFYCIEQNLLKSKIKSYSVYIFKKETNKEDLVHFKEEHMYYC